MSDCDGMAIWMALPRQRQTLNPSHSMRAVRPYRELYNKVYRSIKRNIRRQAVAAAEAALPSTANVAAAGRRLRTTLDATTTTSQITRTSTQHLPVQPGYNAQATAALELATSSISTGGGAAGEASAVQTESVTASGGSEAGSEDVAAAQGSNTFSARKDAEAAGAAAGADTQRPQPRRLSAEQKVRRNAEGDLG